MNTLEILMLDYLCYSCLPVLTFLVFGGAGWRCMIPHCWAWMSCYYHNFHWFPWHIPLSAKAKGVGASNSLHRNVQSAMTVIQGIAWWNYLRQAQRASSGIKRKDTRYASAHRANLAAMPTKFTIPLAATLYFMNNCRLLTDTLMPVKCF